MRLLSKKQVRELALYCPAHIARLEALGSSRNGYDLAKDGSGG